jgi:hypothetical protein
MSFRKFGPNDVVLNTMRTHPSVNFFIYNGKVYYNNKPHLSGAFSKNILNITSSASGGISLYEYNIDRDGYPATDGSGDSTGLSPAGRNPLIIPFIAKDSARASFKTAGPVEYQNEFANHDKIYATYPLTASISREFMSNPDRRETAIYVLPDGTSPAGTIYNITNGGAPKHRRFFALKNRLNHYSYLSEHYAVESTLSGGWNKAKQTLNVISIPSIFYGSKIKEGSMRLRYYVSGVLQAELRDEKENGELIQVTGSVYAQQQGSGSVAGVVMYNEGVVILTGSWKINLSSLPLKNGSTPYVSSSWVYFGAGANDGITSTDSKWPSASFEMDFKGQTEVQTYTMFAHAHKGKVNYSNNPTFLEYNQDLFRTTGSHIYEENPNRIIKNTVSSSFSEHSASFKKQVYISRIALYDRNHNLIGISTLSKPVLKKDQDGLTFKLKLDI